MKEYGLFFHGKKPNTPHIEYVYVISESNEKHYKECLIKSGIKDIIPDLSFLYKKSVMEYKEVLPSIQNLIFLDSNMKFCKIYYIEKIIRYYGGIGRRNPNISLKILDILSENGTISHPVLCKNDKNLYIKKDICTIDIDGYDRYNNIDALIYFNSLKDGFFSQLLEIDKNDEKYNILMSNFERYIIFFYDMDLIKFKKLTQRKQCKILKDSQNEVIINKLALKIFENKIHRKNKNVIYV